VEGNPSHNSTAASGSTARVPEAAAPGAPEFEYEQGMQANLKEGFQGGDNAGTETTHTLPDVHAPTPASAHIHARTPARAHTHARKPVCTDAHTNTHVRALRYMHVRLHTCSTHTYTHA
jgi:hypothetical protein